MITQDPQTLLDFTGKVVLVTGSSSGIGAGIAKRFAQAGADVVIHYNQHCDPAQQVADAITASGRKALLIQANVANQSDVQAMFATTLAQWGRIDVLVNNADIYTQANLLEMS